LACLVNVCASTALTALLFQHWQMISRFYHLLLIWCDWEIHCHLSGITLKSQTRSHSLHFVCTKEPILRRTYDSLACDNLTEISACNLWKFTWKCEVVKCHPLQIFWSTRSSLTTDGWPLRSSLWTFVCPSSNILHHCPTVSLLITFWP
jgi:hypothetical protein